MNYVILIHSSCKSNGETHGTSNVATCHITQSTSRHNEMDVVVNSRAELKIGVYVVSCLY